jgi:LacI family transcriptional regulator
MMEANDHEESEGYEAMQKLLDLPRRADAVFAASDPIAIGAMQALSTLGSRFLNKLS